MEKKLISYGLAILLLMTACTDKKTENQAIPESNVSISQTAANPSSVQSEETSVKTEEDIQTVAAYQFVPDYGICEKGNAPIYVMDPQSHPVVKEDDAEIELLSAVYQNGTMLAKFRTKDYSAVQIPEEEAQVLLETEKGDDSYIVIDSEKGILVRSPFVQRLKEENEGRNTSKEKRTKCVYGEGLPEVGYSFTKSTSSSDYDNYLEKGYITTMSEYCMEDKVFEVPSPTGVYEIKMPGFTETLTFEFVPAEQIPSLESLKGYTSYSSSGIYAVGSSEEEGMELQLYTYSDRNEKVHPDTRQCVLEKGGNVYERIYHNDYWDGSRYSIEGIGKGIQGDRLLFQVPETERTGDFTLKIPKVRIISQEVSDIIEIQIPDGEADGGQKIEFADSTITISKVKRMEEPVYYGNINGEDVSKPAVYLMMESEMKTAERSFLHMVGIQPDSKHSEEANPYINYMAPHFDENGESYPYSKLMGFYAFYEEGDKTVQVQFRYPSYLLDEEFELPIEMTMGN